MKTLLSAYLPSLLRHCFTALAALGAFLATKGIIDPSDTAAVNTAGATIASGLVVILTAVIARLAIVLAAKVKSSGWVAGITDKASGWALWLCVSASAGLMVLALPACSTTVTRTTMPDGTIIEVTAKSSDAAAIGAAVDVSTLLMPILIHADK